VTATFNRRHARDAVAARLARAEAAGPGEDPIEHRLDEYRACLVELDAWIAEESEATP
jgi:hypothetical protein